MSKFQIGDKIVIDRDCTLGYDVLFAYQNSIGYIIVESMKPCSGVMYCRDCSRVIYKFVGCPGKNWCEMPLVQNSKLLNVVSKPKPFKLVRYE